MAEIEIDLEDGEPVEVTTTTIETRTRWKLRDIQIDPESRNITVRFFSAVNGEIIHKTRTISVVLDPETMQESGFWIDNEDKIKQFCKQILQAMKIAEVG